MYVFANTLPDIARKPTVVIIGLPGFHICCRDIPVCCMHLAVEKIEVKAVCHRLHGLLANNFSVILSFMFLGIWCNIFGQATCISSFF
jgi:hypothetical protein